MLDSIYVSNLPPGADAYAGYADGRWATFAELRATFPKAHLLSIAVFASDDADCLDVETGDATVEQVYGWFTRQVARKVWRPVIYTSAGNLAQLMATMEANGIHRSAWRCWSAHYGAGKHICGPGSCPYPAADATQWTDSAPGEGGSWIDESLLSPGFFGAPKPPPALHQEDDMMLATGNLAQTVIGMAAGSAKGIAFANDCTLLAQPAPVLRVAAHSAAGHFKVSTVTLAPSGKLEVAFTDPDVDFVSVSRESSGAGDDVAVGWNLA
jgi:hypothetical protein